MNDTAGLTKGELNDLLHRTLIKIGKNFIRLPQFVKVINSKELKKLGLTKQSKTGDIRIALANLPDPFIVQSKKRSWFLMRKMPVEELIPTDVVLSVIREKPGRTVGQLANAFPLKQDTMKQYLINIANVYLKNGTLFAEITSTERTRLFIREKTTPTTKMPFDSNKVNTVDDTTTLLHQFKAAYEHVGRGNHFVFIYRIRRALDWPREKFDRFFENLMNSGMIAAHPGNPGELDATDVMDSFQDEIGDLFITVTWRGPR